MDQVHTHIVTLLKAQTIKGFQRVCNDLATDEHPDFCDFIESDSGFILTDKRDDIIQGVHSGLLEKQSPGVVLHGAYGSGKTVLMNNLVDLCDQPKEFRKGDEVVEYDQLTYGDTEIDPIEVSLENYDSPKRMLQRIFEGLISVEDGVTQNALTDEFDRQKENLTASDLQALPESQQESLEAKFNDPEDVADIAVVVKELGRGDIHDTLTWLTHFYKQETGRYPAIFLDEFEQAFDIGPVTEEELKLKSIVSELIRKSVIRIEDTENPPYILFANTLPLQDWPDILDVRRDLPDRVDESITYNIDLSREESKELFADLYRRYSLPLLQDYDEEEWEARLRSDEDSYVYPFTEEFLDFALSITQAYRDEEEDRVVRGFRDFKRIANEYFKRWEQDGLIDLDKLYRYGDEIRDELDELERADIDELPGRTSIEEHIEDDFEGLSYTQQRLLFAIAEDGILYRSQSPAIYSTTQLEEIAEEHEIDIGEDELAHVIDRASTETDYFDIDDDGRLVFDSGELTSEAAPDTEVTLREEINEIISNEDLRDTNPIELYKDWYEARSVFDIPFNGGSSRYIEFDVKGTLNYTSKVYLCFKDIPEELQTDSSDTEPKSFEFIVCLTESDEEEVAALYEVSERFGRADDLTESIEDELNAELRHDQTGREHTERVLSTLHSEHPGASDFDRYLLWTKICLVRGLDDEEPGERRFLDEGRLRVLTTPGYLFSPIDMSDRLKSIYQGDYVTNRLGFDGAYNGKETMNLAYAVQHLKYEDTLGFTEPDISGAMMPTIRHVGFDPMYGDDLRETIEEFEDNESFVEDGDINDNYTANFESNISRLKSKLEENDEVSAEEAYEIIFGTEEIDNVTQGLVFLLFVIGDYNEEWILDEPDQIVGIESNREARWESIQNDLRKTVEKKVLKQARGEDIDTDGIATLREEYSDTDGIPAPGRLEELEDRCDTDLSVDYSQLDHRLTSLGSSAAFDGTNIPNYIAELRPLGQIETELLFLITPAIEQLVDQLENAEEVYELMKDVEELESKYTDLTGTDPDLNLDDIEIPVVTTVDDHYNSSTVEELIEDLSVGTVLTEFSDVGRELESTVEELKRHRRQIVPNVEDYDADEDIEDLEADEEFLTDVIEDEIELLRDQVDDELEYLENQEDRVPEGSSWPGQGENVLKRCKEALDESAVDFDYDQYKNPWRRWTNRIKQHIEEESYEEDEVAELLEQYGASESPDMIIEAEEVDVDETFKGLSDSDFERVIRALDGDDEDIKSLRRTLIKQRVRNELGDDQ